MKFYKRDPDRALSGMAELTLKQRGAYSSLIDLLYSRDGDVPDDDRRVAKMLTCDVREWRAVKQQLIERGKIYVEEGLLKNFRVTSTIHEAEVFGMSQRHRAQVGWDKRKSDKQNNRAAVPERNASRALLTPTPRIGDRTDVLSLDHFVAFWAAVPRKVGKGQARRAFTAALKKTSAAVIIEGMQRYASSRVGEDDQFTVHPSTWLNGERWTDQPVIPTPGGRNGRGKQTAHDKFFAAALSLIKSDEPGAAGEDQDAEDDDPGGPGRPLLPP